MLAHSLRNLCQSEAKITSDMLVALLLMHELPCASPND